MLVCKICHGTNIQKQVWIDANTKVIGDDASNEDDVDGWCEDCHIHTDFIDDSEIEEKTPPNFPAFIWRIDWAELKVQKKFLMDIINNMDGCVEFDGILHLIDAIQDYAVDVMGIPEKEVFNITDDFDETESDRYRSR